MNILYMDLKLLENSFYITYSFLVTTGTITFIESLRTSMFGARHILNIETCISIVAAYFYGKFMELFNESKKTGMSEDELLKKINMNRYVDWAITTPLMLFVLLMAFSYNTTGKNKVNFGHLLLLLILNYLMLGSGYIGESNKELHVSMNIIGFIFFISIFYFLYSNYISPSLGKRGSSVNVGLYMAYLIAWSLYGVFYYFDEYTKNMGYNVLDLFSKCFVGIFFWAYFAKIFN